MKNNISQRDYQCKITGALMNFFNIHDVGEFSILMRPDNENSLLLNAVMQKKRPVNNAYFFDEEKEIKLQGYNGDVTAMVLPKKTLVVEYGKSKKEKENTTVYVWKDDSGEVSYGFLAK